MKTAADYQRTAELRATLDEDRRRLETAMTALKEAAVKPFGLGELMARSPWTWLIVAGAAGTWLGLRRARD